MRRLSKRERRKYEAARALGLWPKLMEGGWGALTCGESGRVGGLVSAQRRREEGNVPSVRGGVRPPDG